MKKLMIIAAVAAMTMATSFAPKPALADGGRIAAGVVGGLAVGAIVGSQLNRNDDGYRYRTHYRECRIERRDYEDRYGRLHVRSVRVCD
jgi:hypothetical protein